MKKAVTKCSRLTWDLLFHTHSRTRVTNFNFVQSAGRVSTQSDQMFLRVWFRNARLLVPKRYKIKKSKKIKQKYSQCLYGPSLPQSYHLVNVGIGPNISKVDGFGHKAHTPSRAHRCTFQTSLCPSQCSGASSGDIEVQRCAKGTAFQGRPPCKQIWEYP